MGDKIIHYYSNVNQRDTLTINSRGYAIRDADKSIYAYDKDDYLIRKQASYGLLSRVITNGNVRKEVNEDSRLTSITEQEYDLSHKALPDPKALFNEGKGSQNLLLQSVTEYKRTEPLTIFGPMDPYTVSTSFTYEFDALNRVTQQTVVETYTNSTVPRIIVKRFTYSN